jgi:hypothetical protein
MNPNNNNTDPAEIKKFLQEMCETFGRDFIVIGGWAIHSYNCKPYSFDGDAMISCEAAGTLRDSFIVTKNARLKKSQFICEAGCDIDIYIENQHGLAVPFEEMQAHAKEKDGMIVACVEHLIVLKLKAIENRGHTPKGAKDKEDILALLINCEIEKKEIIKSYLEEEDFEKIKDIIENRKTLMTLANNNADKAKRLKNIAKAKLIEINNEKQTPSNRQNTDKNAPPTMS